MIFPCTGRLSFDFLSSLVSISATPTAKTCKRASALEPQEPREQNKDARKEEERTMSSSVEVEHIGHLDVDDPEEALVAFLELALVEDLDGNDRRVLDLTARVQAIFGFVGDIVERR